MFNGRFDFFENIDFLLPQTVQFDTSINLFCSVLLTVECLFPVFFHNWHNTFPWVFFMKYNQRMLLIIRQYFLTIHFLGFDFIVLSD